MINRGIYIIIIGIIFTGKLKVQWGCLSWFKVTFFPPIGSNFGASTERKNPFFAPLRPKGHMCLRAEYFGASTERKNPFFAPLRPKGHICLSAGCFGASTERKNPFFAPLRPKGHMCLRAENFYIMKTNFYVGTLSPHPWCFNNGIDY